MPPKDLELLLEFLPRTNFFAHLSEIIFSSIVQKLNSKTIFISGFIALISPFRLRSHFFFPSLLGYQRGSDRNSSTQNVCCLFSMKIFGWNRKSVFISSAYRWLSLSLFLSLPGQEENSKLRVAVSLIVTWITHTNIAFKWPLAMICWWIMSADRAGNY